MKNHGKIMEKSWKIFPEQSFLEDPTHGAGAIKDQLSPGNMSRNKT